MGFAGIPVPKEPMRVAVVGAGSRARGQYLPLYPHLAPWIAPVADALRRQYGVDLMDVDGMLLVNYAKP